jgi:hypothetical protein
MPALATPLFQVVCHAVARSIQAQPHGGAHPVRPLDLVLGVTAQAGDERRRVVLRFQPHPLLGVIERDPADVVVAELDAEGVLHGAAAPANLAFLEGANPGDKSAIDLLDLVAVDGVVEEEGEVGSQVQAVAQPVCLNLAQTLPLLCCHSPPTL